MPQIDAELTRSTVENENPLSSDATTATFPAAAAIDVGEVLREFREQPPGPHPHFGFDEPVGWIASDQQVSMSVAACPVCHATTAAPRFQLLQRNERLVTCCECGLGALHPQPEPADLTAFYPPTYYGAAGSKFTSLVESAVRCAASFRIRQLLRGTPPGGRVLDVGCGRGVALSTVANRGYEAHGFEISDIAAAGIDPRVQLRVGDQLADAAFPDGHFDLVVMWHVLEHLLNPGETLHEIQRILKPGGRLAVAVPNIASWQAKLFGPAWFHLDLPRHLYHFSPKTLRRLVKANGFQVEREHHFSIRQNPFGWVQSALNTVFPRHRNTLYSLLKQGHALDSPGVNGWHRLLNKAVYWCGMPVAGLVSLLAAAFRSGGTVCLTTRKPASP